MFRKAATALVPYCEPCARHVALWAEGGTRANQICGGGWLLGVVIYSSTHTPAGAAVFGASVVVALAAVRRARVKARAACGPNCAGAAPAVLSVAGGFQFTSEAYALAVAAENRDRLLFASREIRERLALPRAVVVRRGDDDA